jgi:predicted homoserine dehydrogenase-like protein
VVATAKRDLVAGEVIDGLGHYMTYGLCENARTVHAQRLLPIGLAEDCRLKRGIQRDEVLTYDHIELPAGRLCDELRLEQDEQFFDRPAALPRQISEAF